MFNVIGARDWVMINVDIYEGNTVIKHHHYHHNISYIVFITTLTAKAGHQGLVWLAGFRTDETVLHYIMDGSAGGGGSLYLQSTGPTPT